MNIEAIRTCEDYLVQLKTELSGSDPALIQDAVHDAQDYIHGERATQAKADGTAQDEEALVERMLEYFGSPAEVAEAYRRSEIQVAAALAPTGPRHKSPPGPPTEARQGRLVRIFTNPRAYAACFYLLLALPSGLIYAAWVTVGTALSLTLTFVVIGLPFALFFLSTVRVMALVEGRLVEVLLGERMPRRLDLSVPNRSWIGGIRYRLTDPRLWTTLAYLVLRLPLGVLSFSVVAFLLAAIYECLAGSLIALTLSQPFITLDGRELYLSWWMIPIAWLAGALAAFVMLHLSMAIGRFHARLAKAMLVNTVPPPTG